MKHFYPVRKTPTATLALLALGANLAYAQPRPVAARVPAVQILHPNTVYKAAIQSLKAVDFANMEYTFGRDTVVLKSGSFEHKEDFSSESFRLLQSWLFDIQTGQPGHALVFLDHSASGGSSSDEGLLLVLAVKGGHLAVAQQLTYDRQVTGEGVTFVPATGILTIKARSNDNSPHCCPKNLDVATFAWTPRGFTQTSVRTVPLSVRK
jgi:hypothetical protein